VLDREDCLAANSRSRDPQQQNTDDQNKCMSHSLISNVKTTDCNTELSQKTNCCRHNKSVMNSVSRWIWLPIKHPIKRRVASLHRLQNCRTPPEALSVIKPAWLLVRPGRTMLSLSLCRLSLSDANLLAADTHAMRCHPAASAYSSFAFLGHMKVVSVFNVRMMSEMDFSRWRFLLRPLQQRWNRVRIFDPPDPTRPGQ